MPTKVKRKPRTKLGWATVHPRGWFYDVSPFDKAFAIAQTVDPNRNMARDERMERWEKMQSEGWRIVKVRISEEPA